MGEAKQAGGLYEVSGVMVNADGHPVKGKSVDESVEVTAGVPSADGVGMEGTDDDALAARKSGAKRK